MITITNPEYLWWLLLGLPLVMQVLWNRIQQWRRQPGPPVDGPAGDQALRAALAASQAAHREEHRVWEAEFCALLGVRVPTNGDVYNLAEDIARLEADLEATGVLYGSDAVKYVVSKSGRMLAQMPQHRDLPYCGCQSCNLMRTQLRFNRLIEEQ